MADMNLILKDVPDEFSVDFYLSNTSLLSDGVTRERDLCNIQKLVSTEFKGDKGINDIFCSSEQSLAAHDNLFMYDRAEMDLHCNNTCKRVQLCTVNDFEHVMIYIFGPPNFISDCFYKSNLKFNLGKYL